ncbi:hypothetical protein HPB52_013093 [Rhipicephalus sanguineus]|uniref:Uncharacterized protein n=1 Tax=Rhipicephalus sanguineus TaxID=34632 RepID=A0A9D4Q6X4_RHISA|nr:hypothetical protein HPB52_013093 [Rhipicephalus sanguineus]
MQKTLRSSGSRARALTAERRPAVEPGTPTSKGVFPRSASVYFLRASADPGPEPTFGASNVRSAGSSRKGTRRSSSASRTDADGPGVGNEAGADGAAETGGQQPSPGGTASSSQDPPVPLLETVQAWLQDLFAFVAPIAETLFWEQHYTSPPPADVVLEPACAWRDTNTGTVPSHCPQPRTFVAGPDGELSSLGPTGGNSPRWQGSWTSRASPIDDPLPPNQSAPSDRQHNPLNAGGTERVSGRHEPGWLMLQMWSAWTLPQRVFHAAFDPARFQPGPRPAVVISSTTSPRATPTEAEQTDLLSVCRVELTGSAGSYALYPAPAAFTDVLPEVPFTFSPLGQVSRCSWASLPAIERPCPHGRNMDRPLLYRPSGGLDVPFRGLLLSDRHPIEPSQTYTAEETRILCPLCRVPEISRRAHQDGSLHRSRLLETTIWDTIPRPPQPPPAPTTAEAAVALLRSARPDLLAQGALPAPTSVPPPTLPLQPPVDDLLDFDE